jgi:hypothetical protein
MLYHFSISQCIKQLWMELFYICKQIKNGKINWN